MSDQDRELPRDLQSLFAAYHSAVPDLEPGAGFTPALWARIDGKRNHNRWFGRIARGLVTVAGGFCLLVSAAVWLPYQSANTNTTASYIEVLTSDSGNDDAVETAMGRVDSL